MGRLIFRNSSRRVTGFLVSGLLVSVGCNAVCGTSFWGTGEPGSAVARTQTWSSPSGSPIAGNANVEWIVRAYGNAQTPDTIEVRILPPLGTAYDADCRITPNEFAPQPAPCYAQWPASVESVDATILIRSQEGFAHAVENGTASVDLSVDVTYAVRPSDGHPYTRTHFAFDVKTTVTWHGLGGCE